MRYRVLLCLFIYSVFSSAQSLTLPIEENHFIIDVENNIVIAHIDSIEAYEDLSIINNLIISFNEDNYQFTTTPINLTYSSSYEINNSINLYTLYFTPLPLISIETQYEIIDEPKVQALFTYSDNTQIVTSNIGIELRGGISHNFPKKTFDIEFWGDSIGLITQDVQFGNLRSDDDWILDGLYNEPLRIRSYIAKSYGFQFIHHITVQKNLRQKQVLMLNM